MLVGIVGKANCGKSTFFKSLTMADVLIANYPFATIKPNHGVGFTKIDCICGELNTQCNPRVGACIGKKRFVPVDVLDVAGLVPGAHEGKGMGNQFLDDLRQADAFMHVVDMSGVTNERGEPVNQGHDPAFDIKFLENELDFWVLAIIKKGWDKLSRQAQHEGKVLPALVNQLSGLKVKESIVAKAVSELKMDPLNPISWTEEQLFALATRIRKKTKPMLIVANKMDLPQSEENLKRCREQFPDYLMIPVSAESELALREASNKKLISYVPGDTTFTITGTLSDGQKRGLEYIKKTVLDRFGSTGVQQAIDASVFQLLHYMAIFPAGVGKLGDSQGNILPDCFLLPPESTAFDFANKIHTDLAKNFVAAIDVKSKRKIGRETLLKNRDAIEIMTSK